MHAHTLTIEWHVCSRQLGVRRSTRLTLMHIPTVVQTLLHPCGSPPLIHIRPRTQPELVPAAAPRCLDNHSSQWVTKHNVIGTAWPHPLRP